jgi:exodeoxyribonuclease V alpha subunit
MPLETFDAKILFPLLHHEVSPWSDAGAKFLIARTNVGIVVKGEMTRPVSGTEYRFYGQFKTQAGGRFDGQTSFCFDSFEALFERTTDGISDYLARHVRGLGDHLARSLVEHFGPDTLSVLRADPERAREIEGVGEIRVNLIRRHFETDCAVDPAAYAAVVDLFNKLPEDVRVPRRVITAVVKNFRSDAPAIIKANPYLLIGYRGIGWKTADTFALQCCDYPVEGLERHKAAILEALTRLSLDGHTCASMSVVDGIAFSLLGNHPEDVAWLSLLDQGDVDADEVSETEDPDVALADLAAAERTIANRIVCISLFHRFMKHRIDSYALETPVMTAGQVNAARLIADEPFALLTGAAGSGKTYLVAQVIGQLLDNTYRACDILVVAPTGKAAKRAKELLDREIPGHAVTCSTIHRALGPVPSDAPEGVPAADAKMGRGRPSFRFRRNEEDTLRCRFLVVDEMSMVPVDLMASLLRAVPDGCRVLCVGDPNQLPSVGPGSVLRDLIDAGLPTAELTEVQRSAGRVVRACHAIKDGLVPAPSPGLDLAAGENWIHIEESNPAIIAQEIVALHTEARTMDPRWDMQVVTPQRERHPLSCDSLNTMLSALLNPTPPLGSSNGHHAPPFRVGDKVVRTKNDAVDGMVPSGGDDYQEWQWRGESWRFEECPVVNGDMGEVLDIAEDGSKRWAVVRFRDPDRICRLPAGDAHLIQAYALTCHKAQGSGFPYTIVPVHPKFYWDERNNKGLFDRCWLYTAMSRAERLLVTVGSFTAIRQAVSRKTIHRRRTKLKERLLEQFSDPEGSNDGREEGEGSGAAGLEEDEGGGQGSGAAGLGGATVGAAGQGDGLNGDDSIPF